MTIMIILNHSSILPKKQKQPKINIILSGCWNIKSFSPLLNEFIHTFSKPSYVNTRIVLNFNFLLVYSNVPGKSKNLYENLFEKKNCKQCLRSKQWHDPSKFQYQVITKKYKHTGLFKQFDMLL